MTPCIALAGNVELRLLEPEQAGAIFATVEANRAHLREWLAWVDGSTEVAHTRKFLEDQARLHKAGRGFGYGLWEDAAMIGTVGVHDVDKTMRHAAIGYWLAAPAQGRGLITQAVQKVLAVCYEEYKLERVEIRCATGNRRSWAIPERLGFTFEGILRHGQLLNGCFVDLRLYSLLRHEYYSRSNAS